jgi:hypothetical protein
VFDHIGVFHIVTVIALTLGLYQARRLRRDHESGVSEDRRQRASGTTARRGLILIELVELTLAAIFFLVGGAKLIGRPDMIQLFRDIGIGQWFRYVTGTIEVTGALLLVIPFLSGAAAIGLGAVMIVASLVELLVLRRPPVAALACLSAHALIAWRRVGRASSVSPRGAIGAAERSPLTRGMPARWAFPRRVTVRDSRLRSVLPRRPYLADARQDHGWS